MHMHSACAGQVGYWKDLLHLVQRAAIGEQEVHKRRLQKENHDQGALLGKSRKVRNTKTNTMSRAKLELQMLRKSNLLKVGCLIDLRMSRLF